MPENSNPKPAAKVGHRKSRKGCLKCRKRRVKCDEIVPICGNCTRLRLQCQYTSISKGGVVDLAPSDPMNVISHQQSPSNATSSIPKSTSVIGHDTPTPGTTVTEAELDQRMQLRLLHAFMSRGLLATSGFGMPEDWGRIWFSEVPRIAFAHDNLLYSLLAFSATQVLGADGQTSNADIVQARARYWTFALQEQRKAIIRDPKANIEALTLAAILISVTVFGMLRGRELEPYEAPMDWFQVSQSAWLVSPDLENLSADSEVLKFLAETAQPIWDNRGRPKGAEVHPVYHSIMSHAILQEIETFGGIPSEILQTYEHALVVVSEFRRAIEAGDSPYAKYRRIALFAQLVPPEFVEFLSQKRPRALVVLACFLAEAAKSKTLFIFGDREESIPRCEIEAISRFLPMDWQKFIERPLREMQATIE